MFAALYGAFRLCVAALAGFCQEPIDFRVELLGEAKIIAGLIVGLWAQPVPIHKPVPLLLEELQTGTPWMKTLDEQYRLIRRDRLLGAAQDGCFMPFYVNLEKIHSAAPHALIIEGNKFNRNATGENTEMLLLKSKLVRIVERRRCPRYRIHT